MSKALRFLQEGFRDLSMIAIMEWTGPGGEMGLYRSVDYGYSCLFILVNEEKRLYYTHQYTSGLPERIMVADAITIAMFAGIDVEESKITQ